MTITITWFRGYGYRVFNELYLEKNSSLIKEMSLGVSIYVTVSYSCRLNFTQTQIQPIY